jgi:hypothetical protein
MPEQISAIHVYQDDPIWDRGKRWFQHSLADLDRLYVTSYEVRGETVDVSDVRRHAQEVRAMHPDCVLIHIWIWPYCRFADGPSKETNTVMLPTIIALLTMHVPPRIATIILILCAVGGWLFTKMY